LSVLMTYSDEYFLYSARFPEPQAPCGRKRCLLCVFEFFFPPGSSVRFTFVPKGRLRRCTYPCLRGGSTLAGQSPLRKDCRFLFLFSALPYSPCDEITRGITRFVPHGFRPLSFPISPSSGGGETHYVPRAFVFLPLPAPPFPVKLFALCTFFDSQAIPPSLRKTELSFIG